MPLVSLINADRLWTRLMALAEIGATPAGGVNRQALSDGEIAAWRRVIAWAREAGLTAASDAAGNLFLTLAGRDRAAPPLLVGSHLDSQPTGGKFDGAAGVMAALEAMVSLAEQGEPPARDVIVVAWMNEEGCRFAPGMMGSEAFAGARGIEAIRAVRDAGGVSVGEALDRLHAAFPDLARKPLGFVAAAYLELHIEQGPLLEAADRTIGVVTGIQGKKTFQVVLAGAEGHAGTLPQQERCDALAAFAPMAAALHAEIGAIDAEIKFTIGRVTVEPNAPSVVPARVTFSIDLRHPDNAVLDGAAARVAALCHRHAPPCAVSITPLVDAPSNGFNSRLRERIARAAHDQDLPAMAMLSAAGHDARHLAKVCPAAMIFIPCRDGVSHVEHEWAEPEHVAAGASVLARLVRDLAFANQPPELEESEMPEIAHRTVAVIEQHAIKKIDMADLPAQRAGNPADAAGGRARFFNSGNAFNIKLPPVPASAFTDESRRALAADTPTGFIVCDQAQAMDSASPATTPLMLARYAAIAAGETLVSDFVATGSIWYVIGGRGTSVFNGEMLSWGPGDVFMLPGGGVAIHTAAQRAVLWLVSNEPQLAVDAAMPHPPTGGPIEPVHYPAAEIERQIGIIDETTADETTSGLALIFSSDRLEANRNIMPTLTLSLNTLPAGTHQRAHRHNSAAITLAVRGDACFSMVDGKRCDWSAWGTLVTPPGAPHSHHNDGDRRALFLIVQDGGLHYHARTMGFSFFE